jgi:chromosome segregation ATPase
MFLLYLGQEMGVSRDAEYQLISEIESLQEQLETLRKDPRRKETEEKVRILDGAENEMNELKSQRDQVAEVIATKRAKIQEQKNNINHLGNV